MSTQSYLVLNAALSYAQRGWRVIPLHSIVNCKCTCKRDCRSPGKHPIQSKWQDKGLTDPIEIERVFKKYPHANIGIVTGAASGLFVLDIDPRNGGNDSLQALIDANPRIKDALQTFTVSTGGGGQHYYYSITEPVKSAKKHLFGDGVDLKGDGGYVVAAPSNHASGGVYSILSDIDTAPLPLVLVDLMKHEPKSVESKVIGAGNRNNWLSEQAGVQLRAGNDYKQVETYLLEQNMLCCTPQLECSEVITIAKSMYAGFKNDLSGKSLKTQWQESVLKSGNGAMFSHVLISLSLLMDKNGRNCWPSEEFMEHEFHVTRKTIREQIKKAIDTGYLSRYERKRLGEKRCSYGYVAQIPIS